jgi:hypothetical protein
MTSFMADRRVRFGTALMALLQLLLLPVQVNTSRVPHGLCTQLKGHGSGLFSAGCEHGKGWLRSSGMRQLIAADVTPAGALTSLL